MLDDKFDAKITAYFERLGIDFDMLKDAKIILQIKDDEIVSHAFLDDDDDLPFAHERLKPSQPKIIH